MKKLFFLAAAFLFITPVFAQGFEVPKDYILEKAEDFEPYKNDVVDCVAWLLSTPINEQEEKRAEATKFLMKWINGSPDTHVIISEQMCPFIKTNPAFIVYYMGGWAKYSIASGNANDLTEGSYAGLLTVVMLYENNYDIIKKDKHIEKLLKLLKKGKLRDFVEKNVASITMKK